MACARSPATDVVECLEYKVVRIPQPRYKQHADWIFHIHSSIAIPVTGFNRFIVLYTDKHIRQTIVNPLNGMWVRCRVRKRVRSGSLSRRTENRNCCYLNTQSPSLVQGWTRNGWIDLYYSFPLTNKITSTRLFRWQRNGHSIRWNF